MALLLADCWHLGWRRHHVSTQQREQGTLFTSAPVCLLASVPNALPKTTRSRRVRGYRHWAHHAAVPIHHDHGLSRDCEKTLIRP